MTQDSGIVAIKVGKLRELLSGFSDDDIVLNADEISDGPVYGLAVEDANTGRIENAIDFDTETIMDVSGDTGDTEG